MLSAIKILPHYTYEEYWQWEGRWELIEVSLMQCARLLHQASMGKFKY